MLQCSPDDTLLSAEDTKPPLERKEDHAEVIDGLEISGSTCRRPSVWPISLLGSIFPSCGYNHVTTDSAETPVVLPSSDLEVLSVAAVPFIYAGYWPEENKINAVVVYDFFHFLDV